MHSVVNVAMLVLWVDIDCADSLCHCIVTVEDSRYSLTCRAAPAYGCGVDVQRHGDRCVAQMIGDCSRVDSVGDCPRCGGVAKVVESDVRIEVGNL